MLQRSMSYSDAHWDPPAGLLAYPSPAHPQFHPVRETSWYALGLLLRDRPGDRERAVRAIAAVLPAQFDAPGQPWNGTFRRNPEERDPGPRAQVWKDYDPNWRHFIGTCFALTLLQFEDRLPPPLAAQMTDSIRRAVAGESEQSRLTPHYTNIALMYAFLQAYAGERLHRPEWVAQGESWAGAIHGLFSAHDTFDEYNSPTYYGVDLYGLALWRRYGPTPRFRTFGAAMEAGLWRDIARFYHPDLLNLSGPFDRAYGMDLRAYVSLVGAWMSLALEDRFTPLPDPAKPMDHELDFVCLPTYVAVGAQIPPDVLAALHSWAGPRRFARTIDAQRTATAWLGPRLMIGGESTGLSREAGPEYPQFHPATVYWRTPGSEVGWILLKQCPPVNATAQANSLLIATQQGDSTFEISAPGLTSAQFLRDRWSLPGLEVQVKTDARGFMVRRSAETVEVEYRGAKQFKLDTALR